VIRLGASKFCDVSTATGVLVKDCVVVVVVVGCLDSAKRAAVFESKL
jgi:formyltetrahydrofolate synthetase